MALTPKALLDAGIASYTTLQDGDLLYTERSGAAGKTTYLQLRNDLATRTFPTWTATSADINGGTIDGTVIGAASAAAGTFTIFNCSRATISATAAASLTFATPDASDGFERTQIQRTPTQFGWRTVNSDGVFVANDYLSTIGASGAFEHTFYVNGSSAMGLSGSGLTVVGVGSFTSGVFASGQSEMRTILPQADAAYDLGSLAFFRRWNNGHFVNSPTVSSDARLKDEIADLAKAELRAAAKIRVRTFKMGGKKKVGYIAQEIVEAMKSEGLDAFEYSLVFDGDYLSVDYDAVAAFTSAASKQPSLWRRILRFFRLG